MPREQTRACRRRQPRSIPWLVVAFWMGACSPTQAEGQGTRTTPRAADYVTHDAHVHLTNYVQQGPTAQEFLAVMGSRVGRATLFGIPLQQLWSHRNTGDRKPTYYLQTDDPLYYYSFTDAYIAMAYKSLSKQDQARLDPMITGFNPADMYAADHIRRVLHTFPGIFTGIGEFTIHKEFVSSKVSGPVASLTDPALGKILELAAETGLLVLMHCDLDAPFPKPGDAPAYEAQLEALLRAHPEATIIWAHTGVGRVVQPIEGHVAFLESLLSDPAYDHVFFDISWSEVAKYVVQTPDSVALVAKMLERHPDRFLFGSDEVGPEETEAYMGVYRQYAPLWKSLSPATAEKVRKGNYERLFDRARRRVRAWERSHVAQDG